MSWPRFRQRQQRDRDLAREIESCIAHEVDDNLGRGMSEAEAGFAARRKAGNTRSIRERYTK
jgi:hypothetical protein